MNYLLIVLQIANFSQITHSPTFGRAFTHENDKLLISRKSYFFSFNARWEIHTTAVVLDGANSTKFLTFWVSLQSSHANFRIVEFSNLLQNTKMLIS